MSAKKIASGLFWTSLVEIADSQIEYLTELIRRSYEESPQSRRMWVEDAVVCREIEYDSSVWRVREQYPDKMLVKKSGGDYSVHVNGVVARVEKSWNPEAPFGGYELVNLRFPHKHLSQNDRIVGSWPQLIAQRDHPEVVSYERRRPDKERGEVWARDEKADYLLFKDNLYRVARGYTKDQQVMLVKSKCLKEDKKFQRLRKELEYF